MTQPGREQARYLGARAMLHLEVFPDNVPGVYRCVIYDWFDWKPLFVSGTGQTLSDAKSEAEREAARFVGYAGPVEWEP